MSSPELVWVDIETTGLEPGRHELWEVALLYEMELSTGTRQLHEQVWTMWPDLSTADPMALQLNGFYGRDDVIWEEDERAIACALAYQTAGKVLVGAAPWFDAAFLAVFLRKHGYAPAWSHRLLCVETYAAGCLGSIPVSLSKTAEALGIEVPEGRHTALVDARLARRVFLAVRERVRS